jgi:hypothetical protein
MTFFMRVDADQNTSFTYGGEVPNLCYFETLTQQCEIEKFIKAKVIPELATKGFINGGTNACFCVKSVNRLYDDRNEGSECFYDCWDNDTDPPTECMPYFTVMDFVIAVERKPPDGDCIPCYDYQ